MIQLEKVGSKLVIHSIIDNLLKGASGPSCAKYESDVWLGGNSWTQIKSKYILI